MKTGADLRTLRKARGFGLRELARRAGITHKALQYWEAKATLDPRGYAVKAIAQALGAELVGGEFLDPFARARHGVLSKLDDFSSFPEPVAKSRRMPCNARTRKGTPCRAKSEPSKSRCRLHGGKSTGPRTPEGRAKIAEAQRKRWERWREERGK
ncbi:HGGxSTG domain-containing protein [Tropicimonas aquimaris]|uniref:HGGxSTG domain-containing protein n=1 Tax=Tropicimonas aquimaris TaxID=914152 RepID=A0ABW3IJD6_9RHOB